MTAKALVERWLGSEKGETPQREAKAKAAAMRSNIPWAAVLAAVETYRATHPESS